MNIKYIMIALLLIGNLIYSSDSHGHDYHHKKIIIDTSNRTIVVPHDCDVVMESCSPNACAQRSQCIMPRVEQKKPKLKKTKQLSIFALKLMSEHKASLIAVGITGCWLFMYARLVYASYKIRKNNGWSSWGMALAIDKLQTIDSSVIAHELFQSIQKKYGSKIDEKSAMYVLDPIISFINDVEKELKFLKGFVATKEVLTNTKLEFLFPMQVEAHMIATQKIQRLEYLKQLVPNFISQHKEHMMLV